MSVVYGKKKRINIQNKSLENPRNIDTTVKFSKLTDEELAEYRSRPRQTALKKPPDWRWPQNRK